MPASKSQDENEPVKKKRVTKAKAKAEDAGEGEGAPKKRATRTKKQAAEPRFKLYWGIFNQNVKRVAVFEYEKKKEAEKQLKELSKGGTEHFLQKIKEPVE